MQNTAVVAGLMTSQSVFLFEQQQTEARFGLKKTEGSGQSDDSTANDDNIQSHRQEFSRTPGAF